MDEEQDKIETPKVALLITKTNPARINGVYTDLQLAQQMAVKNRQEPKELYYPTTVDFADDYKGKTPARLVFIKGEGEDPEFKVVGVASDDERAEAIKIANAIVLKVPVNIATLNYNMGIDRGGDEAPAEETAPPAEEETPADTEEEVATETPEAEAEAEETAKEENAEADATSDETETETETGTVDGGSEEEKPTT